MLAIGLWYKYLSNETTCNVYAGLHLLSNTLHACEISVRDLNPVDPSVSWCNIYVHVTQCSPCFYAFSRECTSVCLIMILTSFSRYPALAGAVKGSRPEIFCRLWHLPGTHCLHTGGGELCPHCRTDHARQTQDQVCVCVCVCVCPNTLDFCSILLSYHLCMDRGLFYMCSCAWLPA